MVAAVLRRRGSNGYAAVAVLLAAFPALTLAQRVPWWGWAIALVAVGLIGWQWAARSAVVVTRWSARTRRKSGVASTTDLLRHASPRAIRKRAATVKPSLAAAGRWARWRVPPIDIGIELCRVGAMSVWCLIEDVVMIFGGPRTGKTGWIAGRILDAAGAVLVTSTRTDLLELCGPLRAAKGPVSVFNPVGLAGHPSTITFDPLTGCQDPVTAGERASDLVAAVTRAGGGGEREFWNSQARRLLTTLLHAAALGDGTTIEDVGRWLGTESDMQREVPPLLRRSPVKAFEQDLGQFLGTNPNTRTSISSTVAPALNWLNHPAAVEASARGVGFDVAELLRSRATVFLLGGEETQTAPLVCALTGHIAREARRLAALSPKGRLDPHLTLALDEAALISPVPLESWTADMGGRGVTIIAAFQSRAQLLARWGEHATATILNNTAAVMVFGGTRDRDDLDFWSTLAGERDEPTLTTDMHGRVASKTTRRVPVLPPAQLANLPAGRVLLVRRGIPPVIGRVVMAWHRRDVRDQVFHRDHPVAAARIGGVRTRLLRPARVVGAVLRRWAATISAGTRSTVRHSTSAVRTRAARGWRWLTSAPGGNEVDVEPPTVEHQLPIGHQSGADPTPGPGAEVIPFPTTPSGELRPIQGADRKHDSESGNGLDDEHDDPWGDVR
ncbi:hypothetical protein GCM10010210_47040 [Pseudonocardia hydrocarbonoxydans]|uniref:TraD/TraG TraM recognition site domain-containing protein n=1 Tax=Pseudonocardia hydrocarbonoxydans TaxID=76726 RepID=A0A4Y3WYZ4_9PSEU|nr:hypothetical protein PHY01_49590 [Pseudonocardia hydrocarbonoxydans]